ncbi:hypothetical protein [Psychromonas sp. SR45-3]|nr:hypothetical protein [Psychromonas sp. SR45-3]MBB1274600.1 hypothetical protein [Psychromonas sp. SR45-3]
MPKSRYLSEVLCRQAQTMYVAVNGSNFGLLNSFPVGKVEQYNLRP